MKRTQIAHLWVSLTLAAVVWVWSAALGVAAEGRPDTATIERLTGAKGELNEKEGVFTIRAPRTDLDVHVAGVQLSRPRSASPHGLRFKRLGTIRWSWAIWSSSKAKSIR